jgi:hypothetical protein
MPKPASGLSFYGTVLIGLGLLAAASQPLWQRGFAGENDFIGLYAGARLSGTPQLFSPTAAKRIHHEITGGRADFPALSFIRPPFYSVLLKPLGRLPYKTAYAIFTAINVAVFVLFLWLYAREYRETLILAAFSVPMLVSFANGQDTPLVAALAGIASWLAMRRRDFLAGLVLSLAAIKFHLLLLVPVALILHKRWRFLAGGLTGGLALCATALAGEGLDSPLRMLSALSNPAVHPGAEQMTTLRNLVFHFTGGDSRALEAGLAIAATGLYVLASAKPAGFHTAYGMALIGGLLISHHAYPHDLLLLAAAAPILMLTDCSKAVKTLAVIASLPLLPVALLAGSPVSALAPLTLLAILAAGAWARRQGYNHGDVHFAPAGAPIDGRGLGGLLQLAQDQPAERSVHHDGRSRRWSFRLLR